ncbi:MAG: PEP-CTERM sorting domain-containing protein [Opitutales bacterium]|nr:PEP-CTERM sorting domain-containing protein [Opitutales bacterium]
MNKKTIRFLTTLAVGIFFAATAAKGVVLVTFEFADPVDGNEFFSPGSVTNDPAGALSGAIADRGPGLTAVLDASALVSSGWDTLAADDYVSLRFTVAPGFSAMVNSLRLDSGSGPAGPRDLAIRSSADGFASDLVTFIHDGGTFFNTFPFDPQNLEGLVEFRIFSTSETSVRGRPVSPSGIFRVEYAEFDVTVIPEPSTYAAIVGALFLGLVLYRRRLRL